MVVKSEAIAGTEAAGGRQISSTATSSADLQFQTDAMVVVKEEETPAQNSQSSTSGQTADGVATVASPAAAAVVPRSKYNYPGLLQRVIMALREKGKQVQSAVKLHDVANLLDRWKRGGKIDVQVALDDVFKYLREMIISREIAERKCHYGLLAPVVRAPVAAYASAVKESSASRGTLVQEEVGVKSETTSAAPTRTPTPTPVSASAPAATSAPAAPGTSKRKRGGGGDSGAQGRLKKKTNSGARSGVADDSEEEDTDILSDSEDDRPSKGKGKGEGKVATTPQQSSPVGGQGRATASRSGSAVKRSLKEPSSDDEFEAAVEPVQPTRSAVALGSVRQLPQAELEDLIRRGLKSIGEVPLSEGFVGEVGTTTHDALVFRF